MKISQTKVRILIISGIVLVLCFLLNYAFARYVLSGWMTSLVELNKEPGDDGISVACAISKEWRENVMYYGAEYDFTLSNDSGYDITDWNAAFTLPKGIRPMEPGDVWNASFVQTADALKLSALDHSKEVLSRQARTFGMIVVGVDPWEPVEVELTYRKNVGAMKLPFFFVLVILSLIWCMFLVQTVSEYAVEKRATERMERDRQIILQSISTFINFIDAKDPYTRGHSRRVATIAAELARHLGLSEEEVDHVYYAGLLHDSGKISIPDSILKKVGKLTKDEYDIMKTHPTQGGQMLEDFTAIDGIRDGAMCHHERYDGKGYPAGLSGKEIPLVGRIICVADAYDAMARDRCYRKHLSWEEILSEFASHSGTQFDPEIASIMVRLIHDGTAERLTEDD